MTGDRPSEVAIAAAAAEHADDARLALEAYDAGTPSALPDSNLRKQDVEQHRWGQHRDRTHLGRCPVCLRDRELGLR